MSLVGRVGRKRFRARLATGIIYALLILGAVTTIYPFLVMAGTGFKGATDQSDNRLVPEFWSNREGSSDTAALSEGSLLYKYLFDKYGGNKSLVASTRTGESASPEAVAKYEDFLLALPLDMWEAGFRPAANQPTSRLVARYQDWLKSRYSTIDDLNRAYIEENVAFPTVLPPSELLDVPNWTPRKGSKYPEWLEFKATLPAEFRLPIRTERLWQEYLRGRFRNQFAEVPKGLAGPAKAFEEIRLVYWPDDLAKMDAGGPEIELIAKFFERLPQRFATRSVEKLWAERSSGVLPIESYERDWVRKNESEIKTEFSTRNYRYVWSYIALNGRALWNTAIYCGLAVLLQLIVNPLAAYALSRYPMRSTAKILLFLLATMAFPAEVAMIPSFLLLKDVGLLNTFAALVLPTAASGYMIFLLKGFFDSLPAELFEAGQIDGAKESTMLWKIALPLSRPVLGYLALTAFMAAYGAFMFAFVVAQDQRMWTLMVFIYQLQTLAPKSIVMAALTLAALPTIVVFLLAQNVIMRGIVLPGER